MKTGRKAQGLTTHAQVLLNVIPKQLQFADIGRDNFQYVAHIICFIKGSHSEQAICVSHCRPVSTERFRFHHS